MNILLNGLAALQNKSGVGHYIVELTQAYETLFPEDKLAIWPKKPFRQQPCSTAERPARPLHSTWKTSIRRWIKPSVRPLLDAHFRLKSRLGNFQIYHEPNYLVYPTRLPTVLTVHDLSVIEHPEWHPADRVKLHQFRFELSLRRASHIVTDSVAVREALLNRFRLAEAKVSAVPLGVSAQFQPVPEERLTLRLKKLALPRRYFLSVGTVEPRKNLAMLLRAYLMLPQSIRQMYPLVLAGGWGWKSGDVQTIYNEAGPSSGLIHLGYVADEDLPVLYSGALTLLYPSHYEGFGLPPLEMFACGGCVFSTADPAIQEVTQGKVLTLPTNDPLAWRDAMQQLATDSRWAAELKNGVQNIAANYRWEQTATRMKQIYSQVASAE